MTGGTRDRIDRGASGLRHLRWAREVLATLQAHAEHEGELAAPISEALREEARSLEAAVQALSAAVKAYRDFLERTRVRCRGRVRAAESAGEGARIEAARAALAELEATRRAPLKRALTAEIDALRAMMAGMDARLGARVSPAFVEALYPALARGGALVADDGDPDDDATARE